MRRTWAVLSLGWRSSNYLPPGGNQVTGSMSSFWRRRLILIAILLLATRLRFYRLDVQSFWNDEGNSARLSERSIPLIIEGTASDIHPPLYYLILRGWRELVGETEFGLRSFSAFAGVLTVVVTFALGKEIRAQIKIGYEDKQKGLLFSSPFIRFPFIAALLTAVSPPLIYYSQETRMYALLALWSALSTWLLLRWQRSRIHNSQFTIHYSLFYIFVVTAGLYTHYFFAAVLLTHNLLTLIWLIQNGRRPPARPPARPLVRWFAMMLAVALLYLPWLPIFINQTGGRSGMHDSWFNFLLEAGRWLVLGATIDAKTAGLSLVAAFILLLGEQKLRWPNATIALHLLIPILFMIAAGTTQPEFYKFMVAATPFCCLLLARGEWSLRTGSWMSSPLTPLLSGALILIVLWGNGRSLANLYYNPAFARADYRGMAARITAENHPNAGVILDAPNQWEAFTYYHRDGAPVYPLPKGRPLPDRIDAELTAIAACHSRLYAIFWGEAQRDPERLVERWLDERAFKATDEWIGDVRFVTYAVPDEPATEVETAVSLTFGDMITLNGYTLAGDVLAPGDILQITLFWETAVPLTTRHKIFLHLVNKNGELIAQRDSEPGGGLNLTTNWLPGEQVVDNHGILIPADATDGVYQLFLGLYPLTDPNGRLPIQTDAGVLDAYPLATITIE
ncbi:MAG: DUF2723 domain-containing protein [Chloroflexi bacterium]|nr:DUF2723 domain-containing protein [Chloroflexota bacterium]